MPLILPAPTGGKTRAELREIVKSHGFDHYKDERVNLLIDQAASEVHNDGDWPYKEGEITGSLPLPIDDLSQLVRVAVEGTAEVLPVKDADVLRDRYGDIGAGGGGSSSCVWVDGGKIVRGFPASTRTVVARYLSTTCWESGGEVAASDTDYPLWPPRYQDVIVFFAVAGCYGEDNQAEAAGFLGRAAVRMEQARYQLLSVNRDTPQTIREGFSEY